MDFAQRLARTALFSLGVSSAWAGGMSIGAPSITGVSPGLSPRCLQKLDIHAQGAQAARAAHDCRRPLQPVANVRSATAPARQ